MTACRRRRLPGLQRERDRHSDYERQANKIKEPHLQTFSLSMFSLEGYRALRHGAGLVARSDRSVLSVTGPDRLTWLQGLLTQDVAELAPGEVRDSAYLTAQGRLIADLRVIHNADRTLLDVPERLADGLSARLDGLLFAEDAQVANQSGALGRRGSRQRGDARARTPRHHNRFRRRVWSARHQPDRSSRACW
jgi:folate-binding Fe-S cluster repair protein YgfZ